MDFDTLTLSRWQFALTIMFHYLFPPLSIGLGWLMVIMEAMYLRTRDPHYSAMTRFWTGIFAVNFAVGVATGIVMEFQFGTNWARYARFVGDVFGSALAAEGIFAFFLESGFLAVLVFGWDRVSPKMHFFSTVMVAFGSTFSAVWIVIANSWQHTPAGHHIIEHTVAPGLVEQRAEIVDFWAMVFNPSSMQRLTHVLLGAMILGAFVVMSITAWYILRRQHETFARRSFTLALIYGTVATVLMMLSGHSQAKKLATTQPAKLAALEANFKTESGGTPMYLFGWPDEQTQTVRFGIAMPWALSMGCYFDEFAPLKSLNDRVWDKPVPGLDTVPDPADPSIPIKPEHRPPVTVPFLAYHIMVASGMYMFGLLVLACWYRYRGTLFDKRWFLMLIVVSVVVPYIANQTGWIAAEVGRQPWVVYGLLKTSDAFSHRVVPAQVLTSIVMFALVYALLFFVWVFVLHTKITQGPKPPTSVEVAAHDGFFRTAGQLTDPLAGFSMTGDKAEKHQ